jgi:hypothetical protein
MPPKHPQLRAPCPDASGNAFQALVDPPNDGNHLSFDGGNGITRKHHTAMATPPPAFSTTSIETIDYSIGFGFAALIYVSLEILREFYVDSVDICRDIRVFTCFGLPHHAKCHPNIANSTLHDPNRLETRTKPL